MWRALWGGQREQTLKRMCTLLCCVRLVQSLPLPPRAARPPRYTCSSTRRRRIISTNTKQMRITRIPHEMFTWCGVRGRLKDGKTTVERR